MATFREQPHVKTSYTMSLYYHCVVLEIYINILLKVFENYSKFVYFSRCFNGKDFDDAVKFIAILT
jgi:hypothetical protein